MVTFTPTRLPEVQIVETKVFGDDRGFFMESWNQRHFDAAVGFMQDNHSRSARGVLRGLHYQLTQPQGKLVRVTSGRVFDVAVDMRRSSPRCGQWVGVELSATNRRQLWVPPGFAHGFLVLSESADFLYKAMDHYALADEHVAVAWPLNEAGGAPSLSGKDAAAPPWAGCKLYDR
jgi:dTDP-4-dehydrorhamnose 3,5-epimerase